MSDLVHVLEGVVVGKATCSKSVIMGGCTGKVERVDDPFEADVYNRKVEIDICEGHLKALRDDI